MRAFASIAALCLLGLSANPALASELQSSAMAELSDACQLKARDLKTLDARFTELGWAKTKDGDIREIGTPDDVFEGARLKTAYEVELDNGGYWFGSIGSLKINGKRANFCMVTAYADGSLRDAMKADFDQLYPDPDQASVSNEAETRYVSSVVGGRGVAVFQYVPIEDEDDLYMIRAFNLLGNSKS